jgi:hypothetical protein
LGDTGNPCVLSVVRGKLAPHARPAVGPFHLVENCADVGQKRHVAEAFALRRGGRRLGSASPVLAVAADADFKHPALDNHGPNIPVSFDEGVSHDDSFAKYAVATF